jgi:hypothetical protein
MRIEHFGNGVVVFKQLIEPDVLSAFNLDLIDEKCTPQGMTKVDGKLYSKGGYEYDPATDSITYPKRYMENIDSVHFTENLIQSTYDAAVAYCKIFPAAVELITEHAKCHYVKYLENGIMGPHSDCALSYKENSLETISSDAIGNTLSSSILLNDSFTGGAFGFRALGLKLELVPGDGIIYPSGFIGNHEVEKVESGTRWAFLSFFSHGRRDASDTNIMDRRYEWTKKFREDVGMGNHQQKKVEIGEIC